MDVKLNPDERIDQLYSSNIQIIQNKKTFSFSIDAVLLADFAKPDRRRRGITVDLCAGNGAVGLFFSKKTKGLIHEIEVQPYLADLAQRSIKLNHLEQQIDVLNIDLINSLEKIKPDTVSTVLCNPPYFKNLSSSIKNDNQYYAIARHEIKTDLEKVIYITSKLLKMTGHAYFVFRTDRFLEMMQLLIKYQLAPKTVQFIYPKPGKNADMFLIDTIKNGKQTGFKILSSITLADDEGNYVGYVKKILYGEQ